jgi:hypothetical protein
MSGFYGLDAFVTAAAGSLNSSTRLPSRRRNFLIALYRITNPSPQGEYYVDFIIN